LPLIKKKIALQKETSEKYDLRKYEKKLKNIDIDGPIHQIQRSSDEQTVAIKRHGTIKAPNSEILSRKQGKSLPWLRPVEAEYLRRQIQLCKRKNTDSEKDLQCRLAIHRQKHPIISVNMKRKH
jgi:hypothetical protein